MPAADEQALTVRGIEGVNLLDDPAFLPPSFLQHCENWVPTPSRVLTKRRGTAAFQSIASTTRLDAMLAVTKADGNRYLYVARDKSSGADELQVSANDGAFAAVSGGGFAASDQRYGLAVVGDTLYAGNGVDPLKRVPLGGSAVDLAALGSTTDTGQALTATTDNTSSILGGTYSYCWAVYDATANPGKWVSRGPVRRTTITGDWARLDFTAPSGALGSNQTYHLFVAPVNEELEGAHDQFPAGLAASATGRLMAITVDGPFVPIPSSIVRTGRFLVPHKGRLYLSGDPSRPRQVDATSALVPGLEEEIYNVGEFFPAAATFQVNQPTTGLAVAAVTSAQRNPLAALAAFTDTDTWLLIGDVLAGDSVLLQASSEVGCAAHATVVYTPVGVMFVSHESVYLLPTGLQEPLDVGWPIRPIIGAIPLARRAFTTAMFHRGFYKVALTEPGGTQNTAEWWLDLRRALGSVPYWTGPHRHGSSGITAFARTKRHPSEDDRAWAAVDGGGVVVLLDQPGVYTDQGTTIRSSLRTARLGSGAPYQRKLFTGYRLLGRAGQPSGLSADARLDGGMSVGAPGVTLGGLLAVLWDETWDETWAESIIVEGDVRFTDSAFRSPHQEIELTLTHETATQADLLDLELRYQPVRRLGA